jgi:hypothetical protein
MQWRAVDAAVFLVALFPLGVSGVRADRVELVSGAALEGHASVGPERVMLVMESGTITLPREDVKRVVLQRAPLDTAQAMRAQLGAGDVAGRLRVARFCRLHQLAQTEREVLLEVLAIAPDHAEAHARLGHVRTKDGYVDGRELARAAREARDSQRDERMKRAIAVEQAKLDRDRAALALRREDLRQAAETARVVPTQGAGSVLLVPWRWPAQGPGPWVTPMPVPPAQPTQPPFVINGVRDPHDQSFSLPGVRDPRTYFGR